MQIDERVVDGVTILDLKGKMTLGEGDELLKDKINSLIQQDRKKLLLNLEGVPYIDSAGLGEIVRTYTTVSRQGGKLKLLNLTKRIQDLLAITKLLTVFETYESERTPSRASRVDRAAHRPRVPAALRMARHPSSGHHRRIRPRAGCGPPSLQAAGRLGLFTSLRPSQWTKNLIVFAALMFGQRLPDLPSVLYSVGGLRDFLRAVGRRLPDQRRRRSRGGPPASGQAAPADRVGGGVRWRRRWRRRRCSAAAGSARRSCSGRCSACWPRPTSRCSPSIPGRSSTSSSSTC